MKNFQVKRIPGTRIALRVRCGPVSVKTCDDPERWEKAVDLKRRRWPSTAEDDLEGRAEILRDMLVGLGLPRSFVGGLDPEEVGDLLAKMNEATETHDG